MNTFTPVTNQDLAEKLQKDLKITNKHLVPKVEMITINVGVGSLVQSNKKALDEVVENITAITGQKPVIKHSRKSISNFKLREGMPVGVSVTLRGQNMITFLNKLIHVVFPRIRDFRGFTKKSFDGQGNLSIGIKEHLVFPEINPDDIVTIHGVQITIKTSTRDDEAAYKLLSAFQFPFKEKNNTN
jgi:large subunit ribosomal protein L5